MDGDTATSTTTITSTTMTSSTGTTASGSGSAPIAHAIVSPLMHGLKPPSKLHTTGSLAESWKAYKQVWENYSLISGLNTHTEEYKVAFFLHCAIGIEGLKIYNGFQFESEADRKNLSTNSMSLLWAKRTKLMRDMSLIVVTTKNGSPLMLMSHPRGGIL